MYKIFCTCTVASLHYSLSRFLASAQCLYCGYCDFYFPLPVEGGKVTNLTNTYFWLTWHHHIFKSHIHKHKACCCWMHVQTMLGAAEKNKTQNITNPTNRRKFSGPIMHTSSTCSASNTAKNAPMHVALHCVCLCVI